MSKTKGKQMSEGAFSIPSTKPSAGSSGNKPSVIEIGKIGTYDKLDESDKLGIFLMTFSAVAVIVVGWCIITGGCV